MIAPPRAHVHPLEGWCPPEVVLPIFAADEMPVLLRSFASGRFAPPHARWSILSSSPFDRFVWSSDEPADPFDALARWVEPYRCRAPRGLPFAGGAIGYVGYDAGRRVERVAAAPRARDPLRALMPDMLFGLFAWAVLWDHARREWWVLATGLPARGEDRLREARAQADRIARRLRGASRRETRAADGRVSGDAAPAAGILASSLTRGRYLARVRRVRDLIGAGDLYQVNLSQRLRLASPGHPVALFQALARHSPAPFSSYIGAGSFTIVSASPERFLRLRGRIAESRPIKGTAPRGRNAVEDRRLSRALRRSEKDRAENVMIVDLVRNDLGRVCRPGTVRTAALCRLESYASVHHLVSIVRGELAPGRTRADLIRALFPAGSMTGAPKPRAMQAIEDLEPTRRGVYAGAIGYLSFCGGMDLSIVIRTAIVADGSVWLQVGGGIVADSDPAREYRESLDKALSVRRAIAAAAPAGARGGRPSPGDQAGRRTAHRPPGR